MSGHLELRPSQRPNMRRKIVLTGDDRRVDDKIVEVVFWDTGLQDEYARLRPLTYLNSHAILIIFSVDSPESLKNVRGKWWPEIVQVCKGTPLIVVATKTDLRQDDNTLRTLSARGQMPVTSEEGAEVASEIGAKYIECSAKMGSGVQEVFALALQESMKCKPSRRRHKCVVI